MLERSARGHTNSHSETHSHVHSSTLSHSLDHSRTHIHTLTHTRTHICIDPSHSKQAGCEHFKFHHRPARCPFPTCNAALPDLSDEVVKEHILRSHPVSRVCLVCIRGAPPSSGYGGSYWVCHIREHVHMCSVHYLLKSADPAAAPYLLNPLPDAEKLTIEDCVRVCQAAHIDLEPLR